MKNVMNQMIAIASAVRKPANAPVISHAALKTDGCARALSLEASDAETSFPWPAARPASGLAGER